LRKAGALPALPYLCPHNFLSRSSWESVELYLHYPTCVYWKFYHVAGLRKRGALPPLPYMFLQNVYNVTCLRIIGDLPPLPYICPLNALMDWEWMELYIHSPTCIQITFYRVAALRKGAALLPLPYMCPLKMLELYLNYPSCVHKFLSRGWVENELSSNSTPLLVPTELFITWLRWEILELYLHPPLHASTELFITWQFESWWSSASPPFRVSTEIFITWLDWEWVQLYLHYFICVHWKFYDVAGLKIFGNPPPLPYICPLDLSRGWERMFGALPSLTYKCPLNLSYGCVENRWSATSTPLQVSTELFIT